MASSGLNSLHPLRLLSRTDAGVGAFVESFFLFEYLSINRGTLKLRLRLPYPDIGNSHSKLVDYTFSLSNLAVSFLLL